VFCQDDESNKQGSFKIMTNLSRLSNVIGVLVIIYLCLFSAVATAMPASPMEFTEKQPDGSIITLRVRGDEHYNWLADVKGYTVVRENDWFEYAELGIDGNLISTGLIVGIDDPSRAGLEPGIIAAPEFRELSAKTIARPGGVDAPILNVPPLGTVKNLVVMVRFSNHVSRPLPSAADMDVLFNAVGGDPSIAPTGSVRDVYFENSYGQMTLDSDVNPGINDWITVSNTEAYYANGQSGDSTLWQALREALDVLDTVVDFNDYDTDNNGRIDSIAFIHSGYGAEWGGTDAYGTPNTSRIWSHRWAIQPQWNSNDGVSVFDYHISPGVWGTSGSAIGRIGVIAHETGHFFGLPDLYDTQGSGSGIGSWGLMANSWDFNFTQLCPPHFSPWSKVDLGWYAPTTISQSGQYNLNQAETNPEVYRIDSGYPSQEYLLIENRQNAGFDCTIPQGGLVIWHIDDSTGYNTEGYPGQAGWPQNGNHYRVAVLQADGDYDLEREINRGDAGDTYHAAGIDAIGPGPGNHPNTDAYKNGNIIVTGHTISDVSASGSSMTFCLNGCGAVSAAQLTRGPYLQMQTDDGMTIRWRTDIATDSVVRYGTSVGNLNNTATVAGSRTEHEVVLSGLGTAQQFWYSVGDWRYKLQLQNGPDAGRCSGYPRLGDWRLGNC
jgi:M6 family metalloprotease-like protein